MLAVCVLLAQRLLGPAPRVVLQRPTAQAPESKGRELSVSRYAGREGDGDSDPSAIVTDSERNSYIAGFIQTATQDVNFLILKYDRDGKLEWEWRYNGPGNDVDRAKSIALDQQGNIYISGDSYGASGNGDGRLSELDFVTIKLAPNGQPSPTWPDVGHGVGVRRYDGPDTGFDMPKSSCWIRRAAST